MTKARYSTRNGFLSENFGDQVRQCPHCSEWCFTAYKCHVCGLDPDDHIVGSLSVKWDGATWVLYIANTTGELVNRELFDYKRDAEQRMREMAQIRHPRPKTKSFAAHDRVGTHWMKQGKNK